MKYLLGIDIGTSGAKIIILDEKASIKNSETIEYPVFTPKTNWAEQNPLDWKQATLTGIRKIIEKSDINPSDIKAVGLTGQMHGSVFLDKNFKVIYPAILWCDQRTTKECDEINEIIGKKRIFEITSNPVLTGFQAPKIIWLRKNKPSIYKKVRKILLPKDYIRFILTGVFATDVSDASGTSLFDVKRRKWSEEIIEKLKIPIEFLPEVFESEEITGYITKEISNITKLKEGTPVVAGAGDQAAGGIGNGIVEEGKVSITIGTSGVVFAHSEKVVVDPKGRLHTFCHAVRGKWHLMGVMLSAGGSLRWVRDTFCNEEIQQAKIKNLDTYDIMTEKGKKVPPGCEGLIFLPYLAGERCPYPDPDAKGVFFGLSLKHKKEHIIRSVIEGATFGLLDSIEIMKEIKLPLGEKYIVSGGGGKSDFWCSIMSDIFNKKITKLSNQEGPSYGAAILAGVGIGIFKDVKSACKKFIKEKDVFKPDIKNVKIYRNVYKIYRKLYSSLKNDFKLLKELS